MILYDARGQYLNGPPLPLATRKGNQIPNEQQPQLSGRELNDAQTNILNRHPKVNARSLSSIYNCMGMVFASRRTWIQPEHLKMILDEDDYRRVNNLAELERGDVVVYRDSQGDVSHVGIVAEPGLYVPDGKRQVLVLSQWGQAGEYVHLVDDVSPWLGTPVEYWTDRT